MKERVGISEAVEITGVGPRKLRELAPIIPGASKALSDTNTPIWIFDEGLLRGWVAGTVEDSRTAARNKVLSGKFPCSIHMAKGLMQAFPGKPDHIYFIQCETGHIKIGLAFVPATRLSRLQQGCPLKLTLLATRRGSKQIEGYLHDFYAKEHHRGEWFHPSARLLAYIEKLRG